MSGDTMIPSTKSIGKNSIHLKSCSFLLMILAVFLPLIQFLWEIFVNGAYYSYFLEHHLQAVRRKLPNLLNSRPTVLHDGVRSHIWNWEILKHPQ